MNITSKSHPLLWEAERQLQELERKIEEENYDPSCDGFDEEFDEIKNKLQDISGMIPDIADREITATKGLIKRLKQIAEDLDLYDADAELNMMFPNGED